MATTFRYNLKVKKISKEYKNEKIISVVFETNKNGKIEIKCEGYSGWEGGNEWRFWLEEIEPFESLIGKTIEYIEFAGKTLLSNPSNNKEDEIEVSRLFKIKINKDSDFYFYKKEFAYYIYKVRINAYFDFKIKKGDVTMVIGIPKEKIDEFTKENFNSKNYSIFNSFESDKVDNALFNKKKVVIYFPIDNNFIFYVPRPELYYVYSNRNSSRILNPELIRTIVLVDNQDNINKKIDEIERKKLGKKDKQQKIRTINLNAQKISRIINEGKFYNMEIIKL